MECRAHCSICSGASPLNFCNCSDSPVFLCSACVATHIATASSRYHEMAPADAIDTFRLEGFHNELRKRQRANPDAICSLKENIKEVETWKRSLCEIVESTIAKLTSVMNQLKKEAAELQHELSTDLEAGITEFRAKILDPQPELTSAIAKVLWRYESDSIKLLSCQTDFGDLRRAADAFVFALSLQLRTELPGYCPRATIAEVADFSRSRVVNIYRPLPAHFADPPTFRPSQQLLKRYSPKVDRTPTVARGCVALADGSVYTGSWSSHNLPHGFGELRTLKHQSLVVGHWKHGKLHGRAQCIEANGDAFDGAFAKDKRHGFGKRVTAGGTYVGEFVKGVREGFGCFMRESEDSSELCYIGQYVENLREGLGVNFDKTGGFYAGEYRRGVPCGIGFQFVDGECFSGEFGSNVKPPRLVTY